MTVTTYTNDGSGFTADELAHMQNQLDGMSPEQRAKSHHFRPAGMVASRHEIVMQNGQLASHTVESKGHTPTAHVNQPTPGKVTIGGLTTDVAAAKASGLLPPQWQEGDPLPFDEPAKAPKGDTAGDQRSDNKAQRDDSAKESDSHGDHLAHIAGEVLRGVDQTHGAQVTDRLLQEVADSGDPDAILDRLPHGVTETHVKQVMAGFVAQANSQLATVGASVPMLEELLSDDDLRAARAATLVSNEETMQMLGRKAVDALAQLPQQDPQGFQEMLEGMTPADRKCISYDRNSREWRVTVPGQPVMSFGAAVRLGLVKV